MKKMANAPVGREKTLADYQLFGLSSLGVLYEFVKNGKRTVKEQ